ncbi:MAG: hypothetical protein M3041_20905 [Acidobacteriota bacterium]|nr:hypothetical protein [Acidobacteriota bacterium]
MPENVNPETHHERSDVNVRALLMAMAIFVVFAAISHFVLYGMFKYFAQMARNRTSAPLTDVLRPPDAAIPQVPRLQPFPNRDPSGEMMPPNATTPTVDMEDMRATEEQALHTPGWVDKQKGIVRVPIEVAKQLAVQRLSAGGVQR